MYNLQVDRGLYRMSVPLALAAALLSGCGAKSYPVAPVRGKLTHQGQPVSGGSLVFGPVGSGKGEVGKAGVAQVGPDGSFEVTTYREGDGAVIGKHTVAYSPPAMVVQETPAESHVEEDPEAPAQPYAGLVPQPSEVEIKRGQNEINLELGPPAN
jgi:hypothetical protein